MRRLFRGARLRRIPAALAALSLLLLFAGAAFAVTGDDTPTLRPGATAKEGDESAEQRFLLLDEATTAARLAGDNPLDISQAGALRAHAANAARKLAKNAPGDGPHTFANPWSSLGPNPIVTTARSDGAFYALSGRIGALAIRPSNGEYILGGAQGGIWTYDAGTGIWTPRTSDQDTQTIGALTVAPSNDSIVYAGTGEGALSGDSMYGNGILKSTDGGTTWSHVSGDYFVGVSISRVAVDPTNANHLYVSVLRGRGGARRVTPPLHSRFGIWESKDGGVSWTLLREVPEANGATDIEIDPLNPSILYASFWGDAIYKSTDAGKTWAKIMNGFPAGADFAGAATRFSIAISHPSNAHPATLYAGLDWNNPDGSHHIGEVFKSTDAGASWAQTGTGTNDTDNVEDYCGTQCFYDNVIEVDPTNPNVVYAGGSYGYDLSPQSGGIFRSTDGGATWVNLGWDLHPDFHALAMDPANPAHVLIGNDGGVWYSPDRGGRASATQPLSDADWQDLNGTVDPNTSAVAHRTGLDITQYSSIATDPLTATGTSPTPTRRFWGGTQDNGTQRKSVNSQTWFDVAGGDGGQVLVDPTDPNFVYGTYFGISASLYRFTDGGASFFSNQFIQNGIDLTDRSDFYVPWVLNQNNTNQLFVGSYRMYRTNTAQTTAQWSPISPDLTTRLHGHCTERRSHLRDLRDRRRRRDRRVRRHARRARLGQPRRADRRHPDVGAGRRQEEQDAEPPRRGIRRRPEQLSHRLRRVQRLRRGDAARLRGTSSRRRTAGSRGRTSAVTCRTRRSTRSCSTRPTRTPSTRAPMSARSSPTTVARTGRSSARVCRTSPCGSSTWTRCIARSLRARTAAARSASTTASGRLRLSSSRRSRRRFPSGRRATCRTPSR